MEESISRRRAFRMPKECLVAWIELQSSEARIGYRCPEPDSFVGGMPTKYEHRHATLKGVGSVRVHNGIVTGKGSRVDFVLSPDHSRCNKAATSGELVCKLFASSGIELGGARRRKHKRR